MAITEEKNIEILEKLSDGNFKIKYPKTKADNIVETTDKKVMTSAERTKLAGIVNGANNYVHPTGAGNNHIPAAGASGNFLKWSAAGVAVWSAVVKADVGLGSVQNYGIATKAQVEAGTANNVYVTPLRVKEAIDANIENILTHQDIYSHGIQIFPLEPCYIAGNGGAIFETNKIRLERDYSGVSTRDLIDLTQWRAIKVTVENVTSSNPGTFHIVVSNSKTTSPSVATGRIAFTEVATSSLAQSYDIEVGLNIFDITGSYYVRVHSTGGTLSQHRAYIKKIELIK